MNKIETASQREEKVRNLMRRITVLCAEFYDKASEEQKKELLDMVDDFEKALIGYRNYEVPWDSVLIDVVENIEGRKVKAKVFSTFESVMDKARELFVHRAK